jgi:hypothetical protein
MAGHALIFSVNASASIMTDAFRPRVPPARRAVDGTDFLESFTYPQEFMSVAQSPRSSEAALGTAATPRLSLQSASIGADTTAIRSLDWDRSRFDIEFGLRNGTTYNAFLVRGERTALIDTSHAKFRSTWLPLLEEQIDPKQIDF